MFFFGPIGTFQKSYLLNIITEKRSLTTAEPFNALKKLFRCKTRNETEFISKWNIIHRETQKKSLSIDENCCNVLSANRQCALMHIKTCTRTRLFVQLEQSKVWREEKTHTQNIKQRIHPSARELYRSLCVYLKHYWLKMHDRNRRALRYGCVNKLCKSTIKAVCSQRTRVLQLQTHWSN